MRDTWFNRELPVLDVIVNYDEQHGHGSFPNVELLAAETGRAKADVARAVELLDGPYIKLVKLMSGVDPGP